MSTVAASDQSVGSLSVRVIVLANSYDIGAVVRVIATFKDVTGTLADPTTVTIKVRDPLTANIITGAVVQDSTGVWHADFTPTSSGRWAYRVVGTGAVTAASHGEFMMNVQEIP